MGDIVVTTFEWVPTMPRGFVRDLRVRWALEKAGLAYRVESTPFRDRGADHFAHQPFGQAAWKSQVSELGNSAQLCSFGIERPRPV